MNYWDYIKSMSWRNRRKQRLELDKHTCQTCGSKNCLEVHHKHYDTLFNEIVEIDLITLCKVCHVAITSSMRERRYNQIPVKFLDSVRVTPVRDVIRKSDKYGMEKVRYRNCKRVSTPHA